MENSIVSASGCNSETVPLKYSNDSANKIRELMERWDNRLTLHGQSLIEKYLEGRLTIVLDLQFGVRSDGIEGMADVIHGHGQMKRVVPLVLRVDAAQGRDLHHWNQEPVFVDDVQFVKSEKGVVPSRIGFYDIHDEITEGGVGLMYRSTLNNSYKFIPGIPDWEVGTLSGLAPDNITNKQIQRTSEIMNGIANNQRGVVWNRFGHLKLESVSSSFSIFINPQTIEVCFQECCDLHLEIIDVMLGPFDL